MKNTMKEESMDLLQTLEQELLKASMPFSSSQASAISASWDVDNNPLMDALEANADFAWKFNNSDCDSNLTKLEDELGEPFCATDLAFSSSVAFTPPTSPNTKIEAKQQSDSELIAEFDMKVEEIDKCSTMIDNECSAIIENIFSRSDRDKCDATEQRRIQEIENWLLMATSSQGNEHLSQSQESLTNEAKQIEEAENIDEVDNVLFENEEQKDSDIIVEADVSQIIILPEEEDSSVSTRVRRKRQRDEQDDDYVPLKRAKRKGSSDHREKKRDQNKEAAKRYRDRKKQESMLFSRECEEFEIKIDEARNKIRDMIKERQVLLDLWVSLSKKNSNPNFTIHFPDWM